MSLLPPLDSLLWDRQLIKALFDFQYKWEIYTPVLKRKYGAYVLPILYDKNLIGRIESVADYKTQCLTIKNIWFEPHVKETIKLKSMMDKTIKSLLSLITVQTSLIFKNKRKY